MSPITEGLAIGSGVTEAACKMLIGYRFKQSGMRWKKQGGQHILNLRVIQRSGIWRPTLASWLDQPLPYKFAKRKETEAQETKFPQNNPCAA